MPTLTLLDLGLQNNIQVLFDAHVSENVATQMRSFVCYYDWEYPLNAQCTFSITFTVPAPGPALPAPVVPSMVYCPTPQCPNYTPEPTVCLALGLGLAWLAFLARRRRSQHMRS